MRKTQKKLSWRPSLLVTSALLVVTGASLVVTSASLLTRKHKRRDVKLFVETHVTSPRVST